MPHAEPNRLSATTIAGLVENGELTAEAVVKSCLERIAECEPVVRAWSHLAADQALAAARAFDAAGRKALLNGVPFGVKDIFDTVDMPTTYGSPIYVGWRPAADASAAALPRAAGGILLGKTVTTEFANRQPGPTTNPHNPDFSPGGSSSGSAAAVADFMVPLAIGTQTGGSVIRPAAYCGVVGFKPSFGLFPPAGMRINTETLDTVGIMARSVGDIALFRAAMMAIPYSPPAMPESAPRLALCRAPHWEHARPEGRAALEAAADRLAAAGAVISETRLPAECENGDERQRVLGSFEGLRNHMPELYRHEALLSSRSASRRKDRFWPRADLNRVPQCLPRLRKGAGGGARMGVRVRRDPDLAGCGPSPARPRRYGLCCFQRVVDAALHALFDVASRLRSGRLAGGRAAGCPAPRRRASA